jgi:hypothetical protein
MELVRDRFSYWLEKRIRRDAYVRERKRQGSDFFFAGMRLGRKRLDSSGRDIDRL